MTRRSDRLSRTRILEVAIAILDEDDGKLTLRALTGRLETGAGAIYHHVRTMNDLRAAAADDVLDRKLRDRPISEPAASIEQTALAIYETFETHRWFAGQLGQDPVQPAAVRIWTTIGSDLQRLDDGRLDPARGGPILFRFILGSAVQHADGPALLASATDRRDAMKRAAVRVRDIGTDALTVGIAAAVTEHDDRQQFVDGVRTILRGLRIA